MRRSLAALLVCLAATFAAAAIGSAFTRASVTSWYQDLAKPRWTPPAWVFGPVWTVLYAMMAVAAWLVWRERGAAGARVALGVFALQLAFNAAWSALFFGLRMPGLAFAEIVVLWGLIAATLGLFWRVRPLAGLLLVPYQLWVTYAAALNAAIWRLNA